MRGQTSGRYDTRRKVLGLGSYLFPLPHGLSSMCSTRPDVPKRVRHVHLLNEGGLVSWL